MGTVTTLGQDAPSAARPPLTASPRILTAARLPFPVLSTGAQAGAVLASRLVGAGAGFLVVLILGRTLSPTEVGVVLTALASAVLGEVGATLGRDAVAVQVIPQALAQERAGGQAGRASAFARSLAVQVAVGAPIAGLAAGLAASHLTGAGADVALLTALVVIAMTSLRALSQLVMAAGGIALGAAPLFALRPALWLCAVAGLAAGDALTVPSALGAAAAAAGCATLIQLALGARRLGFVTAPPAPREPEWGRAGRQLILPTLMIGELPNVGTLCASVLLAAPQVAVLGVALRLAGLVALGTRSLIAALGPRLSTAWAEDRAAAARVGRSISALAAPATLAVVALVWLLAEPVLSVFGEAYREGGWTLRVLVLMPLITACAGPSLLVLTAAGRTRAGGRAAWIAAPALAAAAFVGALGGTLGVAICVLAASALWEALLVLSLRRETGLSLWVLSGRWPLGPRAR